MRHELNLELDNSRDKPDKKTTFTVIQRCPLLKTQEVRLKASMNDLLNFARHLTSGQISQNLFLLLKFRYYKTCLRCQSKTFLEVLRIK